MSYMKLKYLPFYLMFFTSLVMVIFIDLVSAQFSSEYLLSSAYWSNITTVSIANLLVLLAATFFDVDKIKENDIRILDNEKKIRSFVTDAMGTDFKDFIDEDNKQRKIKRWKIYIDRKIMKLQNKKTTKKVNEQIAKLKEKIEDKYIKEHIEAIKIKYYYIKMSEIISGYRYSDEDERLENGAGKVAKDIMPKFLLGISLPVLVASFPMDMKAYTPAVLLTIASKVVSLLMNFMNGKAYAKTYTNEKVLYNLDFRVKYIEKYLAWKLNKKRGEVNATNNV